jgi:hypothetical protein
MAGLAPAILLFGAGEPTAVNEPSVDPQRQAPPRGKISFATACYAFRDRRFTNCFPPSDQQNFASRPSLRSWEQWGE